MSVATITSKGQLTIPKPVREALRLAAGDRVEFVNVGSGRFELIAVIRDVTKLRGMLAPAASVVSIDEMNAALAEAVCCANRVCISPE